MKTRYFNRFKTLICRIFNPEVFIVATIVFINNTEYYVDILGLYKRLDVAEKLARDLKDGYFPSKYFYNTYNVDVDCLQDYDDIVIFSLPLLKYIESGK